MNSKSLTKRRIIQVTSSPVTGVMICRWFDVTAHSFFHWVWDSVPGDAKIVYVYTIGSLNESVFFYTE